MYMYIHPLSIKLYPDNLHPCPASWSMASSACTCWPCFSWSALSAAVTMRRGLGRSCCST